MTGEEDTRIQAIVRSASIVLTAILMVNLLLPQPADINAHSENATIAQNMIYLVQGETSKVPGSQTDQDFYSFKVLTFILPHNESRTFTMVPAGARNISVERAGAKLNVSSYGWESSGIHEGQFFIDAPASLARTSWSNVTASTQADFTAAGGVFTNTTFSSGSVHLTTGATQGSYTTPTIPLSNAFAAIWALLNFSASRPSNLTCYISNDNGTGWTSVSNNTQINFATNGSLLKLRFDLTGNTSQGPNLTWFRLTTEQLDLTSLFTVHISYSWTQEFTNGRTTLNLTEALSYPLGSTFLVSLSIPDGYTAVGDGFQLLRDLNSTPDDPNKILYLYMSPSVGHSQILIDIIAPATPWELYIRATLIAIGLLLGAMYVRDRRRNAIAKASEESEKESAEEKTESNASISERRKELIAEKRRIMTEIEETRAKGTSGDLSQEEADKKLAELKTSFKKNRNELSRIARKNRVRSTSAPQSEANNEATGEGSDIVLASMGRIEEDFKRGILPEETYKRLRREYQSKLAGFESLSDAQRLKLFEIEKEKLMDAIVSLDEEHENGKIGEELYGELRASYRRELALMIKKIAESKGAMGGERE